MMAASQTSLHEDKDTMPKRSCSELANISPDFWELMTAHCPLCNGLGPTCIVEEVRETLAGDGEGDAEAEASAHPVAAGFAVS